jgi:predicted glycosyltransferase
LRIWVDLTNSPHVLVLRPLIQLMRADGHEVEVTARDFAQTLGLLDRFGIAHTAIGHHRGGRLAAKAAGLASRSLRERGFIVPPRAVDAQSLVAYADVVISAGGTRNREAVALGTPVYTTFEGRLGAVDERLLAQGRLLRLSNPSELRVEKRGAAAAERVRRDPRDLVTLVLSALD